MCELCTYLNSLILERTYCFGTMWSPKNIIWTPKPKLLGVHPLGGAPIDFSGQVGIYFLHNIHGIVHFGWTGSLAKILWNHTKDALASRWGAFSWFGFRPVEHGKLGPVPENYWIIPDKRLFKAILFSAFSPFDLTEHDKDVSQHVRLVEYWQKS